MALSKSILGYSGHNKEKVFLYRRPSLSKDARQCLLLGGFHGDEPESYQLPDFFLSNGYASRVSPLIDLWIVPRVNPDGILAQTRVNGCGVDLNRNFPTKDWSGKAREARYNPGATPASEVETKMIIELIDRIAPKIVISCHCYDPMVNVNGECGAVAQALSQGCSYPVTQDMGYPTPGSFGTWAHEEKACPVVTWEIQDGVGIESINQGFSEILLKAIDATLDL